MTKIDYLNQLLKALARVCLGVILGALMALGLTAEYVWVYTLLFPNTDPTTSPGLVILIFVPGGIFCGLITGLIANSPLSKGLARLLEELQTPLGEIGIRSGKFRLLYWTLALCFGFFGTHNFYAGHYRRGGLQFATTLILIIPFAGICLFIAIAWPLLDILCITHDGKGREMRLISAISRVSSIA
jgi:hypothetical protein